MNTFETLLHLVRSAAYLKSIDKENEAQNIIKAIKSYPSRLSLGNELLIETAPNPSTLSKAQKDLLQHPMVDPCSDLVDHIPTFSDEECKCVSHALFMIDTMSAAEVRFEHAVKEKLPQVVEYKCIPNCTWDFKKRDTVIQLKIELSEAKPLRLVEAPFNKVHSTIRPVMRHHGKPFQSLHMTCTDVDALKPFVSTCKFFILTIWVGPPNAKITQSGTGYRSTTFPGQSIAKDNAARVIIRPFKEQALMDALVDFNATYGEDETSEKTVPILMQLEDFIRL